MLRPSAFYSERRPQKHSATDVQGARIEALERILQSRPTDSRARFGLALEYERLGRWDQVVVHLREYLSVTDDEGNAYGRLGRALLTRGRQAEARDAYHHGIEAARRHHHPTMAAEFEDALADIGED